MSTDFMESGFYFVKLGDGASWEPAFYAVQEDNSPPQWQFFGLEGSTTSPPIAEIGERIALPNELPSPDDRDKILEKLDKENERLRSALFNERRKFWEGIAKGIAEITIFADFADIADQALSEWDKRWKKDENG